MSEKRLTIQSIIAANVREWRDFRNMSQAYLAQVTGLSRNMISQIEREQVNISVDTLIRLSRALRCKCADILPADAELDTITKEAAAEITP